MPSYKIIFTAKFEGYIDADDAEEAMHEVDIPESESTKYVSNSIDVLVVEKIEDRSPPVGGNKSMARKKPWSGWFISSIDFERQGSDLIQLSAVVSLMKDSSIKDQKCIEETIQLPFEVDDDCEIYISNYGGAGNNQQSIVISVSGERELDGETVETVNELQVEVDYKTGNFIEKSLHGWEESSEGDNAY